MKSAIIRNMLTHSKTTIQSKVTPKVTIFIRRAPRGTAMPTIFTPVKAESYIHGWMYQTGAGMDSDRVHRLRRS